MKIHSAQFQASFVRQAPRHVPDAQVQAAVDSVSLSAQPVSPSAFAQVALAVSVAAQGGGVPALAALSQEVARALVTPEQEEQLAQGMRDGFGSRFVPNRPALQEAWNKIQGLTGSSYPAPQEVNSPIVYAPADSRNLSIGKDALETDLADANVLTFSVAHEEGHRQHRDTAGAKGLESFLEAGQENPKLFPLAFQAVRAGRHENERRADEFAARVAARLGCQPLPILEFLLSIPGDAEHPDGLERAQLVRAAMAEEGVQVPQSQWNQLIMPDPRQDEKLAQLGGFHADPASWQPLHSDKLPQLRERRLEYLQQHSQPGRLVVLDQFFAPSSGAPTHGNMVAATARGESFQGPLLELDTTFSLHSDTAGKLEAIAAAEQAFLKSQNGEEVRQSLRDLSALKRAYALERSAESLEQLSQSGLRQSAVNLSLGHNAADETRRLLQRTLEGSDQAGTVLLQLIRGFCSDPQSLIDERPEVNGPARAKMVGELAQWLQNTTSDPRWQSAKNRYDGAVNQLEQHHNSVVVAAGNEGDSAEFFRQWCSGQSPATPAGFENNDLSNPQVTVVGAWENGQRTDYTSHDGEIDLFAAGNSLLGDEKGTSFAAPRVAAQLARLHDQDPTLSSAAAQLELASPSA